MKTSFAELGTKSPESTPSDKIVDQIRWLVMQIFHDVGDSYEY
jgi:hypothetical protein